MSSAIRALLVRVPSGLDQTEAVVVQTAAALGDGALREADAALRERVDQIQPALDVLSRHLGDRLLIVDDLVDTGKTAQVVRELLPQAHFATVYAKPMGRPMGDTFITEVSQDTWIYFPWDTGLAFQPPIREGGL